VWGVIKDILNLNIDTKKRKEKEKQCPKPRVSLATREEACGISDRIIPECDCYYYIKAYRTCLSVMEQGGGSRYEEELYTYT